VFPTVKLLSAGNYSVAVAVAEGGLEDRVSHRVKRNLLFRILSLVEESLNSNKRVA